MTMLMQFVIALDGLPTDEEIVQLLERTDDATVEVHPPTGGAWVAFDREESTLVDAIVTAVRDLDAAGLAASEVNEDDDLVTIGLIAQRLGRKEQVVCRWAAGDTGPGGFPAPIIDHPRRPCYLWSEVTPWLEVHFGFEQPDVTTTLRAVDLALELRSIAPEVERMEAIRSLLSG